MAQHEAHNNVDDKDKDDRQAQISDDVHKI